MRLFCVDQEYEREFEAYVEAETQRALTLREVPTRRRVKYF